MSTLAVKAEDLLDMHPETVQLSEPAQDHDNWETGYRLVDNCDSVDMQILSSGYYNTANDVATSADCAALCTDMTGGVCMTFAYMTAGSTCWWQNSVIESFECLDLAYVLTFQRCHSTTNPCEDLSLIHISEPTRPC